MDTCTLLENLYKLKKINDINEKNLQKLGIDMNALPNNLNAEIKEVVDTQRMTGLHDMDLINLELWYINKKEEVHSLEQDILKPLQRKVRKINKEIEKDETKINLLVKSIDEFKSEMIADDEFNTKSQEIRVAIAEAEKAIMETPLPPVNLDYDNLINQVNKLKADKQLKCKNNLKKH